METGQAKLFYAFYLEDFVSGDHLLREIDRFLDLSDLRRHLASPDSQMSRPSMDPELMIRQGSIKIKQFIGGYSDQF